MILKQGKRKKLKQVYRVCVSMLKDDNTQMYIIFWLVLNWPVIDKYVTSHAKTYTNGYP